MQRVSLRPCVGAAGLEYPTFTHLRQCVKELCVVGCHESILPHIFLQVITLSRLKIYKVPIWARASLDQNAFVYNIYIHAMVQLTV